MKYIHELFVSSIMSIVTVGSFNTVYCSEKEKAHPLQPSEKFIKTLAKFEDGKQSLKPSASLAEPKLVSAPRAKPEPKEALSDRDLPSIATPIPLPNASVKAGLPSSSSSSAPLPAPIKSPAMPAKPKKALPPTPKDLINLNALATGNPVGAKNPNNTLIMQPLKFDQLISGHLKVLNRQLLLDILNADFVDSNRPGYGNKGGSDVAQKVPGPFNTLLSHKLPLVSKDRFLNLVRFESDAHAVLSMIEAGSNTLGEGYETIHVQYDIYAKNLPKPLSFMVAVSRAVQPRK